MLRTYSVIKIGEKLLTLLLKTSLLILWFREQKCFICTEKKTSRKYNSPHLLKSEFPMGSRGSLQLPGSIGGLATIPRASLHKEWQCDVACFSLSLFFLLSLPFCQMFWISSFFPNFKHLKRKCFQVSLIILSLSLTACINIIWNTDVFQGKFKELAKMSKIFI